MADEKSDSLGPAPRPLDFVYAGVRKGTKAPLVMEVYLLEEEARGLGKAMHFKADKRMRVIGGIYRGALFYDAQAAGLYSAAYTGGQWGKEHPQDVLEWIARDTAARQEQRNKALEGDAKKCTLIDEALAGLRELYAAMRARGDYEGMQALELAVLRSLRHGP